MIFRSLLVTSALLMAAPAMAGNALMVPGTPVAVAKSVMTVTPGREWNRLSARPGRDSETWTIDGDGMNGLNFYGGIESGRSLFREVSKKTKPLPHFSTTMLLTDIPELFENSYRIALDTPLFTVSGIEPVKFLGQDGVRFTYSFRRQQQEILRQGEATATIVGKRLYLISFEAPTIHYFDRDVAGYREIVGSAKMDAVS